MLSTRFSHHGRLAGLATAGLLFLLPAGAIAQRVIDFGDLSLPAESFYNGTGGSGSFVSGGVAFLNHFDPDYGSWGGFAYSNVTDFTTPGWGNQYAAITGSGLGATGVYAVGYVDTFTPTIPTIQLPEGSPPLGIHVANTAYAYYAMRDGDDFSRKFGGPSGGEPDFFRLTIHGFDLDRASTGAVEFYLADYRAVDNALDHIVDAWTWVDLSGLSPATRELEFTLESSDMGIFGMNTPAYFAVGSLTVVPEPGTYALWAGFLALGTVYLRVSFLGRRRNKGE
jgi:hypothetical protein